MTTVTPSKGHGHGHGPVDTLERRNRDHDPGAAARVDTVPTVPPMAAALVAAVIADPDALDQLAAALAPRLAVMVADATTAGALTTGQAARRAGLHDRTIRRALAARTLRGQTVAGRWRVDPDDLDAWLERGAPTSTVPAHAAGRARSGTTLAGVDAIAGRERAA